MASVIMLLLTVGLLLVAFGPLAVFERAMGRPQKRGTLAQRIAAGLRFRLQLARLTGDYGLLFFRRGKSSWWYVAALTNYLTPTATAINGGTLLDKAIADLSGWDTQLNRINEPWWDSNVDIQTDGPQQLGDASFTFFDDDGTGSDANSVARQAVDTLMVEGLAGFIVNAPKKKGTVVAADKVNVWPVKLGARNTDYSLDVRSARYICQFAVTGTPAKLVAVT